MHGWGLQNRASVTAAAAAVLILALAAAAVSFRPARRLVPGLFGLTCGNGPVCVEVPASLGAAERLYSDSLHFVGARVAPLERPRPFLFCSTSACAQSLGLQESVGQTTGPFGTAIGPAGWLPHIVRHELIHQVQNERLGVYRLRPGPGWLLEGMAYSLSEDPRQDLGRPWQQYRRQFEEWHAAFPHAQLWERARQAR